VDGIDQLEGRHDRARGEYINLQPPARHLFDLLAPSDKDLMEDILRRPGALHLQGDRLLSGGSSYGGQTDQRRPTRSEGSLQHFAP